MTFKTSLARTALLVVAAFLGGTSILVAAVVLWAVVTHESTTDCDAPAAPGVDWFECDKSGANLSGADLSNAFMGWALLPGANLSGANLSNAGLIEADLTNADLSNADLTRADLTGANLSGANLRGANLLGADPQRAQLLGTDFSGATWFHGQVCAEGSIGACN